MSKTVLHLFHADPASMKTVRSLAESFHTTGAAVAFPRFAGEGATVISF